MSNWKLKLYQFMQGRYGIDGFGRFLLIASMVVILASNLIRIRFVYLAGLALLAYAWFRILSKNIYKRQQENEKYSALRYRFFSKKSSNSMNNWSQRQNTGSNGGAKNSTAQYNFYRCRSCGQTIRVPKGKGTLKITCPGCGNSFIEQT